MDRYPTIAWLLKFKRALPPVAGGFIFLAGIYLSFRLGAADFAVFGLILAPVIYALVRSYVELIDVIAEMLLPK